jgi:hypothetical protein
MTGHEERVAREAEGILREHEEEGERLAELAAESEASVSECWRAERDDARREAGVLEGELALYDEFLESRGLTEEFARWRWASPDRETRGQGDDE